MTYTYAETNTNTLSNTATRKKIHKKAAQIQIYTKIHAIAKIYTCIQKGTYMYDEKEEKEKRKKETITHKTLIKTLTHTKTNTNTYACTHAWNTNVFTRKKKNGRHH